MSTIKVDTIATRTGSGNITASNAILAPSIGGSSDTNTSLSFPGSDVVQLNNAGTARHKFHNLNGTSLFEVQASSTGGGGAGGAFLKFKGSNGTPVDIASIDGSMTNGTSTSESGILSFFTMNSGTNSEKVRIFSNGAMAVPNGISLGNGISAAASNLLDDYEEGTWTPDLRNADNANTFTTEDGYYTKVGNRVFAQFRCDYGNTGGGGGIQIRNLPFSYNGNFSCVGIVAVNGGSMSGNNKQYAVFASSGTTFQIYNGGTVSSETYSFLSGSLHYITNS
tara:strand:- start:45 stop:884 length:840 start_codon:yes stop_codon:yes gene_type:complete